VNPPSYCRVASAILGLFSLLGTTACSTAENDSSTETPPAGWPQSLSDFSMTWTAEPGIDLTKRPAVVARAYIESFYLADFTDDERYLYPGFEGSVSRNQSDGPEGSDSLWPASDGADAVVGTFRQHLLRIDQSGQDVSVVGCMYTYDSALEVGGKFKANTENGPFGGINAFRVELQAPKDDDLLPPQQGPSRAPFGNVFGNWKVTNHQGGYLVTAEWPNHSEDNEQCLARSGVTPESRKFYPGTTYQRSDFPVLPATPGWPAESDTSTHEPR